MQIQEETIQHIAHLARLKFEGKDMEAIQKDLSNIVSFMDKLNELDTTGVEPLVFMSEEINVLREDVAQETITVQQALKNAPKKDSDYFRIPKVLDKKNA
jgi:aspartyl-tRNA(Asn)/glutamyl-tRNA(Gln) amidotransferase subunit C